ncbi:aromatic ring-hydroxylating oxygenase subunit alpha [Marinihelvus fidelis]|nr:aromatic ring-hydroxylating dioxygenase subunit alpha [Marinihelvus fidelis]
MNDSDLRRLVDAQPPMRALDRAFYAEPAIYARELEQLFMRSWLYAGHVSEIPAPGDWFLYELDTESVIIVRGRDGGINALLNVCRHRGSRICVKPRGSSKRLTCLYHGWTYDLEGRLRAAAHMGDDFDKDGIALKRVACQVVAGMIFINFAEEPSDLAAATRELNDCLAPYRLDQAKVAHRQAWSMAANWKLAVENYCECYHCAPAHPEYSRGHALADPEERYGPLYEQVMARAPQCGLRNPQIELKFADAPGFGADVVYTHYPMWKGHVTGSEDGRPVAPLLGDISDYYGGCADLQIGPVTFGLAYCDYVVIYAFRPVSHQRSVCDITWLVRGDAVEGQDYDLAQLTWLWDVTTEADKRIIERNAEGVNSRFYEPGPLSKMEKYGWDFLSWYLATVRPA